MKKVLFGTLLLASLSGFSQSKVELRKACKVLANDTKTQRSLIRKNHLTIFTIYSEKLDGDLELSYDCKEEKLLVLLDHWDASGNSRTVSYKDSIEFNYNNGAKSVSFNLVNRKYELLLTVGDLEFEEDSREYNEDGKIVRGELKKIKYKDKVIFTKGNLNGTTHATESIDGTVNVLNNDDYYFAISDFLYPELMFLNYENITEHTEAFAKQSNYNLILEELSSLEGL